VNVLGRSVIGSFCQIGTGTIILPDIKIGKNVIIGAGSVITKNVPDNVMVVGVPAKIVKELTPIDFL
jgi:acetyltransferase-like isoleucine patch superfamily enzyme